MNPIANAYYTSDRAVGHAVRGIGAALKAWTLRFSGRGASMFSSLWRTNVDYSRVDPLANSAVMAIILRICRTFPEAPIRVNERQTDGTLQPLSDHAMTALINRPNPYYSGELLWMATAAEFSAGGNAYWLKVRSARGRVVELWWMPASLIEPKWPEDGRTFISHYEYKPGGRTETIDPADVIHFRFGFDPKNVRKGLSPIASALREVYSDDEAANFSGALLRNLGVPGVIITADSNTSIDETTADTVKQSFKDKFGGDKRGEPMVLSGGGKVSIVSFSPEQMDLKSLRRLPEERISAVLGFPAVVAGLGAGLDRSTYNNMAEAREDAYEANIMPTKRLMAAELKAQLLPEFVGEDTNQFVIDYDYSMVRVLQDDQDKLAARVDRLVRGGWVTVGAAKRMIGQPATDADDYYLRPVNVVAVPLADGGNPPTPPPPPAPAGGARTEDDERPGGDGDGDGEPETRAAAVALAARAPHPNGNGRVHGGIKA